MIALAPYILAMCNTSLSNECPSSMFILLKERERLEDESNQTLCFPPEKRWNLLLLILSLLQHSVSACNISPALLGWNRCPPTALSSATINSSAPVPGLSWESSAGLCLLWAAQGRRRWPEFLQKQPEPKPEPAQDNTGLLILVQHRQTSMVCYKWEMHHHTAA